MEIEDSPEDNGKPFKCSRCPSTFTQRGNLLRHIATIHEGKKRTDVPNSKVTEESYDIEGKNLHQFLLTSLLFYRQMYILPCCIVKSSEWNLNSILTSCQHFFLESGIYSTIGIVKCTFDVGIVSITNKPYNTSYRKF